jgi:hypothetical protein
LEGAAGLRASVPAVADCSYAWLISGGTAVSGAASPALSFNAGGPGRLLLACTATNAYGSSSSQAQVQVAPLPPPPTGPVVPIISAPAQVPARSPGNPASVVAQPGCSYAWTVTGGSLGAGQGSPAIAFTAGDPGTLSLVCTVANAAGSASAQAQVAVTATGPEAPRISAPAQVPAQSAGNAASVQIQPGCSYLWSVTGGGLEAGQGTPAVSFSAGAAGTLVLTCTVSNPSLISASAQALVAVLNPAVDAAGYYGPGLNVDALANTPVGKAADFQVSYRFRASHSGALKALRPFFIWSATTPGYALGTGGSVRIQLQSDDGSGGHNPSGTTLGTALAAMPVNDSVGFYPLLPFTPQPQLQAGSLYHAVFSNIDPDPVNNWVCLDSAYMDHASSPMQPTVPDLDLATLWRQTSAGAWSLRRTGPLESYTPILELDYADGASQGQGYMEFWIGNPKPISGAQAVRERFTVSGGDRLVVSASVRAKYVSGPGPLGIRLEQADGTLIDQGSVANLPVTPGLSGAAWAKVAFAAPRRLLAGQTYHLLLSAPADTVFTTFPMRKGSDKGFQPTTVFTDGYAQFNAGGGWVGWDQWGQLDRRDGDLQFFFEVVK